MLEQGHSGEYLQLLASLDGALNHFEVSHFRDRALAELGVAQPSENDAVVSYAKELLGEVLLDKLALREALRAVADLCRAADMLPALYDFYLLHLALNDLLEMGTQHYWDGATLSNIDSVARARAARFIAEGSAADGGASQRELGGEMARHREKAMARPDIYSITEMLRLGDMTAAKRALREWWIPLKRESLPGGDCWVIGTNRWFESQGAVFEAIGEAMAGSTDPRIFVGRSAFWSVASAELFDAGHWDELRRRLPGALEIYNAQAYATWAKLLARDGFEIEAGLYFFFSGLYGEAEVDCVARFKRSLARAHPNEIVGRMPNPCRSKWARQNFPPKVYEDLATVPCPDWLKRRP